MSLRAPHILRVLRASSATSFRFRSPSRASLYVFVWVSARLWASVTVRFSVYMQKYVVASVCFCSRQHAYLSIFHMEFPCVCPCTPSFAPFKVAQLWHCQSAARLQFAPTAYLLFLDPFFQPKYIILCFCAQCEWFEYIFSSRTCKWLDI